MVTIFKYEDKRKMMKRVVLASALIMVAVVVNAEDDVKQKIAAVGTLFDEAHDLNEHVRLGDMSPEQYFHNILEMCKDGVEQVKHDIGRAVIGDYFTNLESADRSAQRMAFIKKYMYCYEMVSNEETRTPISGEDIVKRKKKMEKIVEVYRNGGGEITFVKKGVSLED